MSPKVAYVYGKCIILLNLHSFLIRYKKALNGIHHPADLMLITWLCSSSGNATIKILSRTTRVKKKKRFAFRLMFLSSMLILSLFI